MWEALLWNERRARILLGTASVVLLLALWEVIGRSGWIDIRFISAPSLVAQAAVSLFLDGGLWRHVKISATEFLLGFALSIAVGIPLGLLMGWFRRLRLLLEPLMMAFYSMPRTAMVPLIIVWFGIGLATHATVVFLGAVFPIVVNTMVGVLQVDPILVRAARSFGAHTLQLMRYVLLPFTLPYMMAGIRLGLGRALVGVILSEMYVSTAGIGNLIMTYQSGFNTDKLMLLVFITASLGVIIINLAQWAEAKLGRWRQERLVG